MKTRRAKKRPMCKCGHEAAWHTGPLVTEFTKRKTVRRQACQYGHDHVMGGCKCPGYHTTSKRGEKQFQIVDETAEARSIVTLDRTPDLKKLLAEMSARIEKTIREEIKAFSEVLARPSPTFGPVIFGVGSGGGGAVLMRAKTPEPESKIARMFGFTPNRCMLAILDVLAQAKKPITAIFVSIFSGYSMSGSFSGALTTLRKEGLIEGSNKALTITPEGRKLVPNTKPFPKGDKLLALWSEKLDLCSSMILTELYDRASDRFSATEIAERTNYAMSGTFSGALTKLRKLNLIEGSNKSLAITDAFK